MHFLLYSRECIHNSREAAKDGNRHTGVGQLTKLHRPSHEMSTADTIQIQKEKPAATTSSQKLIQRGRSVYVTFRKTNALHSSIFQLSWVEERMYIPAYTYIYIDVYNPNESIECSRHKIIFAFENHSQQILSNQPTHPSNANLRRSFSQINK